MRLGDYPHDLVRLRCSLCDRAGQYRRETLVAKWGASYDLRAVLVQLSADCPRWKWSKRGKWPTGCGVQLAD